MKTLIKYRILDILIFLGIVYAIKHFTSLKMVEYTIGFFIGYVVFVVGPIVYNIKVSWIRFPKVGYLYLTYLRFTVKTPLSILFLVETGAGLPFIKPWWTSGPIS